MVFRFSNPRQGEKSVFQEVTEKMTFTIFFPFDKTKLKRNFATVEWNNVFQLLRIAKEENSIFYSAISSTYFHKSQGGKKAQICSLSTRFCLCHIALHRLLHLINIFLNESNLAEWTKQNDAQNWWRQLIFVSINFSSGKRNGASWWCLFMDVNTQI